ncbi:IS66 family transposase [Acidithiobacillus ferrooxidans]|uniref:IS66 family transposase n=1 Tax=Acidithiobacillus ferrooxidans TaxID=920 RepID=UPI0036F32DBB
MTWVGHAYPPWPGSFRRFRHSAQIPGEIAIHDGWAPYRKYECFHDLCNAHHLRELTLVHEQHGQHWAKNMIDLPVAAHRDVADGPLTDVRMAHSTQHGLHRDTGQRRHDPPGQEA